MQRIIVETFGPIKKAEIDITNIVVLIGEQASGKSTLAKLVYFFKTMFETPMYTESGGILFLNPSTIKLKEKEFAANFKREMYQNSKLTFVFDIDFEIIIENGKVIINKCLERYLKELEPAFFASEDKNEEIRAREMENIKNAFKSSKLPKIFNSKVDTLYIPASRNISVSFNSQFQLVFFGELYKDISTSDKDGLFDWYTMRQFLQHAAGQKDFYANKTFKSLLDESNINYKYLVLAEHLCSNLLKGQFVNQNNVEYIRTESGVDVRIEDSSTGQQEAIRIAQDLYSYIFKDRACFRVIEEPEAHLFPTAQKHLMEIVSLFINSSAEKDEAHQNQVIITTHSPYILTSFAIMLMASKVSNQDSSRNQEIGEIIPELSWINPNSFRAYALKNGVAESIYDKDNGLIDQNYLDTVSEELGYQFHQLIDIYSESFKHKAEW